MSIFDLINVLDLLTAKIIDFLTVFPGKSSEEIFIGIGRSPSTATIKRALRQMLESGLLEVQGKARATRYFVHRSYPLLRPVDLSEYFSKEADERQIRTGFNHELIADLSQISLFTPEEDENLRELHGRFRSRVSTLSPEEFKQESERLAIDLSWKSSQIEGNTYSLLETERLLKEKITAEGKTLDEATMLLNHKAAIDFVVAQPDYLYPLEVRAIEDIHSMLLKDLGVDRNIRHRSVGISGTNYRPLDNEFQIREAMIDVCRLVNRHPEPYARALLLLLLISYIQPFNDGNKRTARIIANAALLAGGHCPLSFRTVDPLDYKKAMLVFYEINNLQPFKRLFIEQAEFAVNTYF